MLKVICDYDDKPHVLNDDDRPCKNPTSRYAQWQPCTENNEHMAEWYPRIYDDTPIWYMLCRDCNIESYVLPTWPLYEDNKGVNL